MNATSGPQYASTAPAGGTSLDRSAACLSEALAISKRLCTLLADPAVSAVSSRLSLRLARAHALSVVDQLTDLVGEDGVER